MCLSQKGGLPTTALRIVSIDWSKAASTLPSSPEGSPPDEGGQSDVLRLGGRGGVIKRLRFELPRRFPTVRAAMELDQLGVAQHVERIVEEDALACLGVAEEAL